MPFYFSPSGSPPAVCFASTPDAWTQQPALSIPIPSIAAPGSPPLDASAYAPFSYQDGVVTVGSAVWDLATSTPTCPFRPALAAAFVQFLVAWEGILATGNNAVVTASALSLVQQLVAANLPLTFAETLFFRHGYMFLGQFFASPSDTTYVDLQPGMRLRIESEIYQTINPSTATGLNGFVPNGTTYVEVGTYPNAPVQLGLNPFLTGAATVGMSSSGGIGGTIDLSGQAPAQLPYLRLCYPALGLPGSGSQGWAGTQRNATLLSAPGRSALEALTQQYVANGAVGSGIANFFNGRTVVTPEITVFVTSQPQWVPLGTTVRNLLERLTATPYFGSMGWQIAPPALLQRSLPMQASPLWGGPSWVAVSLDNAAGGYQFYAGSQCDSLDLPLLAGDVVSLALP